MKHNPVGFLLLCLLFAACTPMEPITVEDAGTPAPAHRIQQGYYRTADGARLPIYSPLFDQILQLPCYAAMDGSQELRCFPAINYFPQTFKDDACTLPILQVSPDKVGKLAGIVRGPGTFVFHVGNLVGDVPVYGSPTTAGGCLPLTRDPSLLVYELGEDVTASLEVLHMEWAP